MKLGLCECGCGDPTTVYKGTRRRFITGHNKARLGDKRGGMVACERCGREVYAWSKQLATKRYCSIKCRDDTRRERVGPENPCYRERVEVACNACGAAVQVLPGVLRRRPNQYCSYSCGRIGQARGISGTRGTTVGKKLARARDGHCCRLCDFRLALHVHHIIPRSQGGNDDVGNLITLCPNHHALVHRGHIKRKDLRAAIHGTAQPGSCR